MPEIQTNKMHPWLNLPWSVINEYFDFFEISPNLQNFLKEEYTQPISYYKYKQLTIGGWILLLVMNTNKIEELQQLSQRTFADEKHFLFAAIISQKNDIALKIIERSEFNFPVLMEAFLHAAKQENYPILDKIVALIHDNERVLSFDNFNVLQVALQRKDNVLLSYLYNKTKPKIRQYMEAQKGVIPLLLQTAISNEDVVNIKLIFSYHASWLYLAKNDDLVEDLLIFSLQQADKDLIDNLLASSFMERLLTNVISSSEKDYKHFIRLHEIYHQAVINGGMHYFDKVFKNKESLPLKQSLIRYQNYHIFQSAAAFGDLPVIEDLLNILPEESLAMITAAKFSPNSNEEKPNQALRQAVVNAKPMIVNTFLQLLAKYQVTPPNHFDLLLLLMNNENEAVLETIKIILDSSSTTVMGFNATLQAFCSECLAKKQIRFLDCLKKNYPKEIEKLCENFFKKNALNSAVPFESLQWICEQNTRMCQDILAADDYKLLVDEVMRKNCQADLLNLYLGLFPASLESIMTKNNCAFFQRLPIDCELKINYVYQCRSDEVLLAKLKPAACFNEALGQKKWQAANEYFLHIPPAERVLTLRNNDYYALRQASTDPSLFVSLIEKLDKQEVSKLPFLLSTFRSYLNFEQFTYTLAIIANVADPDELILGKTKEEQASLFQQYKPMLVQWILDSLSPTKKQEIAAKYLALDGGLHDLKKIYNLSPEAVRNYLLNLKSFASLCRVGLAWCLQHFPHETMSVFVKDEERFTHLSPINFSILLAKIPKLIEEFVYASPEEICLALLRDNEWDLFKTCLEFAGDKIQQVLCYQHYKAFRTIIDTENKILIHEIMSFPQVLDYVERHAYEFEKWLLPYMDDLLSHFQYRIAKVGAAAFVFSSAREKYLAFVLLRYCISNTNYDHFIPVLLSLPELAAMAHHSIDEENTNELLRLAENINNAAAVNALRQLPAVLGLANSFSEGRSLRRIAQDRESALGALTVSEKKALERITRHYINDKSLEDSCEELRQRLVVLYQKKPACYVHGSKTLKLPLTWEEFKQLKLSPLEEKQALKEYYKHTVHTAWRYFLPLNPWMSKKAEYAEQSPIDSSGKCSAYRDYLPILIPICFAALDSKYPPIDTYQLELWQPNCTPEKRRIYLEERASTIRYRVLVPGVGDSPDQLIERDIERAQLSLHPLDRLTNSNLEKIRAPLRKITAKNKDTEPYFDVNRRFKLVILEIAGLERAHNWDKLREVLDKDGVARRKANGEKLMEEYDDKKKDKVGCFSGSKKRIFQALINHPLFKAFTINDVQQAWVELVRVHFNSVLSQEDISLIDEAIGDYITNLGDVEESLYKLNLTAEQQNKFIAELIQKEGQEDVEPYLDTIEKRFAQPLFSVENQPEQKPIHILSFHDEAQLASIIARQLTEVKKKKDTTHTPANSNDRQPIRFANEEKPLPLPAIASLYEMQDRNDVAIVLKEITRLTNISWFFSLNVQEKINKIETAVLAALQDNNEDITKDARVRDALSYHRFQPRFWQQGKKAQALINVENGYVNH